MKARTSTVVTLPTGEIRLTVKDKGRPVAVDFFSTDAEAVGSVLKALARKGCGEDILNRLKADRDALVAAVEILEQPQMEFVA